MAPYINVTPAAVYVGKVEQAEGLKRTVAVLQSNFHRFLLKRPGDTFYTLLHVKNHVCSLEIGVQI